MRPWYCVRAIPQHEIIAKKQLEQQGFATFDPTYLVKLKDRHIAVRRLFGCYFFVSFDEPALWPQVKNTVGVADIITHQDGNCPYRMASPISETIESLRKVALSLDEIKRDGKARISAPMQIITSGCHVRILAGPLQSFNVQKPIVEWADHERAALLISLFGRQMRVEFFLADLERVD